MSHPVLSDDLVALCTKTQGRAPEAARVPAPGVYWLKTAVYGRYWIDKTGRRMNTPEHTQVYSVRTWELKQVSDWFLAEVECGGYYYQIANDCGSDWSDDSCVVVAVSDPVRPPT